MKLYTRSGDDGSTGLFGGGRVAKDNPRVEAYGTVDETNAAVGIAAAACLGDSSAQQRIREILLAIQSRLFDLGADLATPPGSKHEEKVRRISEQDAQQAEAWIDEIDGLNEPMSSFVLPGGTELAARLHLARTICRRAERRIITLGSEVSPHPQILLNRLSDLLFAMARLANRDAGVDDVPWKAQ